MSDKEMNPKQARFVEEYLKDGNGVRAATAAGYSAANARNAAWKLVNHNPAVMEALKAARALAVQGGAYNLERAMNEADRAIELAKATKNANAYVKAVELKAKLNGLLVEKHDIRAAAGFSLVINRGSSNNPEIEVSRKDPDAIEKQMRDQKKLENAERETGG